MPDNTMFVVFLLYLLLIGGVIAADRIRRRRTTARLKRSHRRVVVKIKSISSVPWLPIAPMTPKRGWPGQRLWIIEATWFDPKTNMIYAFKSERLDYDVAIRYHSGDPITVLIEPDNPKRYQMEIAR